MMNLKQLTRSFALPVLMLTVTSVFSQRQMENLGRGVIVLRQSKDSVFVSWRMLGTDPDNIGFNLYCVTGEGKTKTEKVNNSPLTNATYFVDTKANLAQKTSYYVRSVIKGIETETSKAFSLPANAAVRNYLSLPLQNIAGYTPNDVSVSDLDGDGEYEIVLHQAGRGRDNPSNGVTDPPLFQAYKLDGTLLWTINLGKNIREGAHYTQFMVYYLDGDGKAEIAMKTADGTIDGK